MYTVDYFISKFEKIPDIFILNGTQGYKMGVGCAYGQCRSKEGLQDGSSTPEGRSLTNLLQILVPKEHDPCGYWPVTIAARINNGEHPKYQQPTPKQRILAALYDIKKMSNEQEVQVSDTTKLPKEQEAGKTIHVYHTVKVSATIFEQAKEMILQ